MAATGATILLVHGTGVREPGYTATLGAVRSGFAAVRPDVRVEPCAWGEVLGSHLRAAGASIPGLPPGAPSGPARWPRRERDDERARWALLYADPWAELDLFVLSARPDRASGPARAGEALRARAAALGRDIAVRAAWAAAGLNEVLLAGPAGPPQGAAGEPCGGSSGGAGGLDSAVAALLDSEAFSRALGAANVAAADGLPRLVARALTAWGLARVPGGPDTVPRETREAVVDALVDGLGGEPRGLGGAVSAALSLSSRIRDRRLASRLVTARRGALTGLTLGFAGDVLSYLVRGRAVRAYVADRLRELPRPVVLLGHSLGGVVAFDLLASGVLGPDGGPDGSAPSVPPVDLLVTVGSQAPLLYELDALPSRPFGAGLPAGFPPWINIYDPRDLLSFLASGVFGDQVRDIAVDNGHPVWAAHTSYFANPEVYRLLARAIPEYRT